MKLDIERVEQGEKTILYVSGRVDTQTAPDFQETLDYMIDGEKLDVILDFKEVEYVSSAGLRAILYVYKKIQSLPDSKMKLRNVREEVMEVLDMTGFTEFLEFEENMES